LRNNREEKKGEEKGKQRDDPDKCEVKTTKQFQNNDQEKGENDNDQVRRKQKENDKR
jgi:hypothetical protein